MARKVPVFEIDLDLPHEARWREVASSYSEELHAAADFIHDQMSSDSAMGKLLNVGTKLVTTLTAGLSKLGIVFYGRELEGFASASGLSLGEISLLQFAYELAAKCTSCIFMGEKGPHHIRTMDWEMDFMSALSVDLHFVRRVEDRKIIVYKLSSWAGYIGALTGVRPNGWSVSVNFRLTDEGGIWKNLVRAVRYSWPIGFLVRVVLETESEFERAVESLSQSELIAPVYFTVCGIKPGEGAIVTRNRNGEAGPRLSLSDPNNNNYLAQPNVDHWVNPDGGGDVFYSFERRALVNRIALEIRGRDHVWTQGECWELISIHPIFNELTVSATYMNPVADGSLETRIPSSETAFVLQHGFELKFVMDENEDYFVCSRCNSRVHSALNPRKRCSHSGEFHSSFSDCSKLKCALGLGSNVGKQHWSCCFSLDEESNRCSKSGTHVH